RTSPDRARTVTAGVPNGRRRRPMWGTGRLPMYQRGELASDPMILDSITEPADLRRLDHQQLAELAKEIREVIVETVSRNGGHLGSNLGAVELTLAVHRVFDSPNDIILWDTGHQTYVHKLLTGRRE